MRFQQAQQLMTQQTDDLLDSLRAFLDLAHWIPGVVLGVAVLGVIVSAVCVVKVGRAFQK